MIPRKVENELHSNGLGVSREFRMKASAKAFRLLSDTLYSDKVRAIIRELSCNAYDSHLANGNAEEPFHIHLPNELQPYFAVRDFGTGLSVEDVMNLYTTYFESTKEESADAVGALGLGSKSPFSYVDSFVVTSYFDGVKSSFVAFLDGHGIPNINHLGDEKTEEPNGLNIEMPVDPKDFRDFNRKARVVLKHFVTKPKVTGSDISIENMEFTGSFGGGKVKFTSGHGVYAVMGQVEYPIDFDVFSDVESFEALADGAVYMYFDLGDLDFAPSREALSYDATTVQKIKDLWESCVGEITAGCQQVIDSAPNIWEARLQLKEYVRTNSLNRGLLRMPYVKDGKTFKIHNNEASYLYSDIQDIIGAGNRLGRILKEHGGRVTNISSRNASWYSNFHNIPLDTKQIICVDNTSRYVKRIGATLTAGKSAQYFTLPTFLEDQVDEVCSKLSAMFDGLPVVKVSTLPEAPKEVVAKTLYPNILAYDGSSSSQVSVDFKSNDVHVYVDAPRGEIQYSAGTEYSVQCCAKNLGITVYALRYKKERDLAEKNPNWITLDKYMEDYIKANPIDKKEVSLRCAADMNMSYTYRKSYELNRKVFGVKYSKFPHYKEYVSAVRKLNHMVKYAKQHMSQQDNRWFEILKHHHNKSLGEIAVDRLMGYSEIDQKLLEAEPLLAFKSYYSSAEIEIIKMYIHKGVN